MSSALLIAALLSLYLKQPPRLSFIIPSLISFSLLSGFLSFGTSIFNEQGYWLFNAVFWTLLFWAFIPSIFNFHLNKWFAAVFFLYGLLIFTSIVVTHESLVIFYLIYAMLRPILFLVWIQMIRQLLRRAQDSYQSVVEKIESLDLKTPFLPFSVMISSTVEDLLHERNAADQAIQSLHLDRFRAETIGSLPNAPRMICEFMARRCDLFILLIGRRYGYIIEPEKISVVQFEYQIARAENPQKILVYVKNGTDREPLLQEFLQKVENFDEGYFRSSFDTPEELFQRIHVDVARWLASRAKQKN